MAHYRIALPLPPLVLAVLVGAAAAQAPVRAPTVAPPAASLGVVTPISDPSGKALETFYAALRKTAAGAHRTKIVVWGASHVAADSFTKPLRRWLQARFGDAGPGFVGLARPWHNYNHRDVTLRYSKDWDSFWVSSKHNRDDGLYGLAGCTFVANSSRQFSRLETARRSAFGRTIDSVELFYWQHAGGGDLKVTIDDTTHQVRTRSKEPGPAFQRFELPDTRHAVELRPRGNGDVVLFGAALERSGPGVVMDAMGINGARAATQLKWNDALFAAHLQRRDPDLIVLAYGTNATGDDGDPIEAYERRLDTVIARVRRVAPRASCVYVGPSDRPVKVYPDEATDGGKRPRRPPKKAARKARRDLPAADLRFAARPRQKMIVETQRRVAHRHGCGYWDWVAAQGGDLSMLRWVAAEPRMGARDYVHFTGRGYQRLSELFRDALMSKYGPIPEPKIQAP